MPILYVFLKDIIILYYTILFKIEEQIARQMSIKPPSYFKDLSQLR